MATETMGAHLEPPEYANLIAGALSLSAPTVASIIALLDEGCTVPFIARYRKEATGGAEDIVITQTAEQLKFQREFFARKQTIVESISTQGKLTAELRAAIENTQMRSELEDLYLPYRPKRRTRATIARDKGLEPLAERMWLQQDVQGSPEEIAAAYVDNERGVHSADEALRGARDIVAERVVETAAWRGQIRDLTWQRGLVHAQAAKGKKDIKSKFTDYYNFAEPVAKIPSHRILAILRGEKEGYVTQHISPDPDVAKSMLCERALQRQSIWTSHMNEAIKDGYDRLLSAQVATDVRSELKLRADREAIDVFAANLRDLLMAAPFGARSTLGIDPGYRTGCKVVVLSATGALLEHGVVYPTAPRNDVAGTEKALDAWFKKHPGIEAIAVGNGTGGRETFAVVRSYVKKRGLSVDVVMANESGASVYSASEVAREEFPDHDVTVRGAVSIARRLQDPLAELVKIDPKSIGVGQYQHDVDQKLLRQKLDDVVVSCVNRVGVDANTASAALLRYVSGLGPKLAKSLVAHRDSNGGFKGRAELKKVPGMGAKTFEQAAGFLRIKGSNPLDNTAVHPERYALVKKIAKDLARDVRDVVGDRATLEGIELRRYVDDTVGLYTLEDIVQELEKPGRDPRDDFTAVDFREDVQKIADLEQGMILNGVVTNVTDFGAFVDVRVHQDGLVHVSQIANRYVRNPADELHVAQTVRVRVLDVDEARKRISLSIKAVND